MIVNINTKTLTKITLFASFLLIVAVSVNAAQYLLVPVREYGFQEQISVYEAHGFSLRLHIGGGILALMLGTIQAFPYFRHRFRAWHKKIGYAYTGAVVVSSIFAFPVALNAYGFWSNRVSFIMLAVLWGVTTVIAAWHGVNRRIGLHRRWIIRSYALTLAAVSLRAEVALYGSVLNMDFIWAYSLSAWTCWVFNILIAELINYRMMPAPLLHTHKLGIKTL